MSSAAQSFRLESGSAAETLEIGRRLGEAAGPGDLICLIGDLGSGKTTLAQGIGIGLRLDPRQIASPTFTLVAEHRGGTLPLYHLDVYRLSDAAGLHDLGIGDYLRSADGLVVIEWADKVVGALPEERLEITLEDDPKTEGRRVLTLCPRGAEAKRLVTSALEGKSAP